MIKAISLEFVFSDETFIRITLSSLCLEKALICQTVRATEVTINVFISRPDLGTEVFSGVTKYECLQGDDNVEKKRLDQHRRGLCVTDRL